MPETASGAGLIPAVHILVLAAGASSRMNGQDKLLMSIGKMPLLRAVATVAVATGASVLVALPPDSAARQAAIAGLAVQIVTVAGAIQGLSRTIARGVAAISAFGAEDGLMILPGDMPDFDPAALSDLVTRFQADPGQIIRGASASGQPGHPDQRYDEAKERFPVVASGEEPFIAHPRVKTEVFDRQRRIRYRHPDARNSKFVE